MNILVTGADGFIGSHLTELLHRKGFRVTALSQYNSFNNWGWLEKISCLDQIEVVSGDIRDPFFCKEIMDGVDCVFHLAALIAIPYSCGLYTFVICSSLGVIGRLMANSLSFNGIVFVLC